MRSDTLFEIYVAFCLRDSLHWFLMVTRKNLNAWAILELSFEDNWRLDFLHWLVIRGLFNYNRMRLYGNDFQFVGNWIVLTLAQEIYSQAIMLDRIRSYRGRFIKRLQHESSHFDFQRPSLFIGDFNLSNLTNTRLRFLFDGFCFSDWCHAIRYLKSIITWFVQDRLCLQLFLKLLHFKLCHEWIIMVLEIYRDEYTQLIVLYPQPLAL